MKNYGWETERCESMSVEESRSVFKCQHTTSSQRKKNYNQELTPSNDLTVFSRLPASKSPQHKLEGVEMKTLRKKKKQVSLSPLTMQEKRTIGSNRHWLSSPDPNKKEARELLFQPCPFPLEFCIRVWMEQRELLVLHSRKNVVIPIPPPSEEKKAHLRMHPFGTLKGRGAAAAGEGSFLQKSTREESSSIQNSV